MKQAKSNTEVSRECELLLSLLAQPLETQFFLEFHISNTVEIAICQLLEYILKKHDTYPKALLANSMMPSLDRSPR